MDLEFYASLCAELILFGIYTVLFAGAMYLLLRRRRSMATTAVHGLFIALTSVMYAVSATHVGLSIRVFFNGYLNGAIWDPTTVGTDPLCITKLYLPALNFVLSDAIVIWRAYLLWNYDLRVCVLPALMVLATAAVAIAGAQQAYAHIASVVLDARYPWDLAMNSLTLATNVLVTALIAARARWYSELTRCVPPNAQRRRNQAVLALLIESGAFYCLTWGVFFVVYWCRRHGNFLITDAIAQLTGIYATLIVVLVALKMTSTDTGVDAGADTDATFDSAGATYDTGATYDVGLDDSRVQSVRGPGPIVIQVVSTVDHDRVSLSDFEKSARGGIGLQDSWQRSK